MTPDEFKKLLGTDIDRYTQEEVEVFYNASINLFNCYFEKWKKEKFSVPQPV